MLGAFARKYAFKFVMIKINVGMGVGWGWDGRGGRRLKGHYVPCGNLLRLLYKLK